MATRAPLTRRQRDILRFFQDYVRENEISPTLEEIANHFGLNKVTIFGHVAELERKGVLRRAAPGISRGLQLVSDPARSSSLVENLENADHALDGNGQGLGANRGLHVLGLNVLGTIAAGAPIETLEEPEVLPFEDLAPPDKDVFVLRVQGDSMIEDAICDGDLVVVEKRSNPRQGQTVVAVLPDEVATLKRFYREAEGRIRLQPANASLQPIVLPASDVEVRGVVIGVIRRF